MLTAAVKRRITVGVRRALRDADWTTTTPRHVLAALARGSAAPIMPDTSEARRYARRAIRRQLGLDEPHARVTAVVTVGDDGRVAVRLQVGARTPKTVESWTSVA